MVLFKFQVPSKFNILLLGYILYVLEGGIFVLFSSSIVLYINFLSQYSEFYYFALFFLHVPISWIALANYGLLVSIAVYYILFFDLNLFLYVKAFIFSGIIFTGLTLISGML